MRIQHNITALNAANRLKSNESTVSKNIQKLSSGYRINSAADDAAGLAVSEKMRKQINGLSQAEDNTQNGISLIQTAEGGLNETSAILQRMNTLAVEASNGTYKQADRQNLQMEINSLNTEVDRISTSTKFNEISLLNGDLSAKTAAANDVVVSGSSLATTVVTAAGAEKSTLVDSTFSSLATTAAGATASYNINYTDATGATKSKTILLQAKTNGTASDLSYSVDGGNSWTVAKHDTSGATVTFGATDVSKAFAGAITADTTGIGAAFTAVDGGTNTDLTSVTKGTKGEHLISVSETVGAAAPTSIAFTRAAGTDSSTAITFTSAKVYDGTTNTAADTVFTVGNNKFAFVKAGADTTALGSDVNFITASGTNPTAADVKSMADLIQSKTGRTATAAGTVLTIGDKPAGSALVFQVGAENVSDQRASLNVDNMNAASLGLTAIDISTQDGAKAAIDIISAASASVSTTRAQLGALQNELEHTANNLSTMNENLTSAESTIRDVDMTNEYVQFSKNQILTQAANSMLAQANAQPQNVLSLLKG